MQELIEDHNSRIDNLEANYKDILVKYGDIVSKIKQIAFDLENTKVFALQHMWHYDVSLPNLYLMNVYHLESPTYEDRKRWVNGNASISTYINMDRGIFYQFKIQIVDFAHPSYEEAFSLRVDGEACVWHSKKEREFIAHIGPSRSGNKFYFELYIPEELRQADLSVSFSFRSIKIEPLEGATE